MIERFKPKLDKLYWCITLPTELLVLAVVVLNALFSPATLFLTVPIFLFVSYFLVSTLFGYAELREETLFIKYGFFLKKEIPYSRIRSLEIGRGIISESMMSLKNAMEHIRIGYNRFDVTVISLKDNSDFLEKLKKRMKNEP